MKNRIGLLMLILLMTLISCGNSTKYKTSSYEDGFVEGEDCNPTVTSLLFTPSNIAVTSQGIYLIAGNFVYYADPGTMEAKPLCHRPNCLHNQEQDSAKVPECDAFIGSALDNTFIANYKDALILTCLNKASLKLELIRMDFDGSNKKTLISDLDKVIINTLRIHRGAVYYFQSEADLEGKTELSFNVVSFTGRKTKPVRLYSTFEKNTQGCTILPAGNHVFFSTETMTDTTTGETTNKIFDLDIRTGEVRTLFQDGQYSICGFRNGKLIIGGGRDYYEYSPESGDLTEETGIRAFSEEHPDWNCHPECITEELTVFSCVDFDSFKKGETDSPFVSDQFVVDRSGKTLCRLEGKGWATRGQIAAGINGRRYLIEMSGIAPFSIDAYPVENLLAGNPEYTTLLWAENVNDLTRAYILHNPDAE